MFRQTPFYELFSGAAHKARPADVTVPLPVRLAGETVLLLTIAGERAATVRVSFNANPAQRPVLAGTPRQISNRASELSQVLSEEAKSSGAKYVIISLSLEWTLELGLRAGRSGSLAAYPFGPFEAVQKNAGLYVTGATWDNVYAVIDHPVLDRSLVFSYRRDALVSILEEVKRSGLQTVSVRCAVASQLEYWFRRKGEAGLDRDLLVSDGLSVCLVQFKDKDFSVPDAGTLKDSKKKAARPRQSSTRPSDVVADAINYAEFAEAHGRMVQFVGPSDVHTILSESVGDSTRAIVHAEEAEAHDPIACILSSEVLHDFNPEAKEERAALPMKWRKVVLSMGGAAALLAFIIGFNLWFAFTRSNQADALERATKEAQARFESANNTIIAKSDALRKAQRVREWVGGGYHAQNLVQLILQSFPQKCSMERISAKLEEGSPQLVLKFTLLGEEATQAEAVRMIERVIVQDCRFQIGSREVPLSVGHGGMIYSWKLIIPVGDIMEARK